MFRYIVFLNALSSADEKARRMMDEQGHMDPSDMEGRAAAASYIADLTSNLAEIARTHGLETLSYVLEMARLEAESTAHECDGR
jgi:hypothetical protein